MVARLPSSRKSGPNRFRTTSYASSAELLFESRLSKRPKPLGRRPESCRGDCCHGPARLLHHRNEAAMKSGDQRRLSTVLMIMAGLKDRDIDARGKATPTASTTATSCACCREWLMKQRPRRSIELYKQLQTGLELAQAGSRRRSLSSRASCRSRCPTLRLEAAIKAGDIRHRRPEREGHGQGDGGAQGKALRPARHVQGRCAVEEAPG